MLSGKRYVKWKKGMLSGKRYVMWKRYVKWKKVC